MSPAHPRGFALVAVLWMIVMGGTLVASLTADARFLGLMARQEQHHVTARWARVACEQILAALWAADTLTTATGPETIGDGTTCEAGLLDPDGFMDLNRAAPELLTRFFQNDSLTAALLDWRDPDTLTADGESENAYYRSHGRPLPRNGPLLDPAELVLVRGFQDPATAWRLAFVTTKGTGRVNVNAAPPPVLVALPGVSHGSAAAIIRRRALEPFRDVADLVGSLAPLDQQAALTAIESLTASVAFGGGTLLRRSIGYAGGQAYVAHAEAVVRPVGRRLEVLRLEVTEPWP